jgi:hypothetical protein
MSAVTLGTDVYLYGGIDVSDLAHDSLLRYSIASDSWQPLHPANRLPGPRALALLTANIEDQELVLYGGTAGTLTDPPAGTSNYRIDLGALTWSSTAAPGPPSLADGGAIYDSTLHRILVWGGRDAAGALPVEVWEFSLGSYSWRQVPTIGTPPTGRTGHRLVYDTARRRFVLFGGRAGASWSDETWQLAW